MRAEKLGENLYSECLKLREEKYYTEAKCVSHCEKRIKEAIDKGLYVILDSRINKIRNASVWPSLISNNIIVILTSVDDKEFRFSISLVEEKCVPKTRGVYAIC